jgi:hypothetical protein
VVDEHSFRDPDFWVFESFTWIDLINAQRNKRRWSPFILIRTGSRPEVAANLPDARILENGCLDNPCGCLGFPNDPLQ